MMFGDYNPTQTDTEKGEGAVSQQEEAETLHDERSEAVQRA